MTSSHSKHALLFFTLFMLSVLLFSCKDEEHRKEEVMEARARATEDLFALCKNQTSTDEDFNTVLERDPYINYPTSDGVTALLVATTCQVNEGIIISLIESGADVNYSNVEGITPLHAAASANPNARVSQVIIDYYGKIEARTNMGRTPLYCAALTNSNLQVLECLIRAGADVNASVPSSGSTVLMAAVGGNDNHAVIASLLEAGSDVNQANHTGLTALELAVFKQRGPSVVRMLAEAGADLNAQDNVLGKTALITAAGLGSDPEMVQLLLELGANPLIKDENGHDALFWAMRNDRLDLNPELQLALGGRGGSFQEENHSRASLLDACANPDTSALEIASLLASGASVNLRARKTNGTPLIVAAGTNTDPRVTTILLENGADYEAVDNLGVSALNWAAGWNSNPEVTKALLDVGADINRGDRTGITPLMRAVMMNYNTDVVELLLSRGADLHVQNQNGKSAIHYIGLNTDSIKMELLLKAGANINQSDFDGMTPLMIACQFGINPHHISSMMKAGASPKMKNRGGLIALDYAKQNEAMHGTEVLKTLAEQSY